MSFLAKWRPFLDWFSQSHGIKEIFRIDDSQWAPWQRWLLGLIQRLVLSFLRFRTSRSDIQAGALTFITLLSLVPVLAFLFSIAKSLGLYQKLQIEIILPLLNQWVDANQAPELRSAIEQMFAFVENTDFASLGTVGFVTLGYAVIRLLGAAEHALNGLWGVTASRSWTRKISDYLSVSIIVPLVLLLSVTTSQALSNFEAIIGDWSVLALRFLTLSLLWWGFGLLYYFMPNTKVLFGAALRGGVLGGTVWWLVHHALIKFQVGVADYNAIYAGFSAFPVFMIWIYASWWTVLIGGTYAAAHQLKERYRQKVLGDLVDFRYREELALKLMLQLSAQYTCKNSIISISDLVDVLEEELGILEVVIQELKVAKLVATTTEYGVLLAHSPKDIQIFHVLDAIKGPKMQELFQEQKVEANPVAQCITEFQNASQSLDSNWNLAKLVQDLQVSPISKDLAQANNSLERSS